MADVRLADGSIAMAHAPGMEMGGQCVAGASLLLSRNTSGTTKTAYAIQLVAADEPECGACRPTWVGAHPLLANRLVAAALARGLLVPALGVHDAVRAEVKHGHMRVDFQLTHAGVAGVGHTTTLLEVKTVGCADYAFGSAAPHPKGYDLVYGLPGVKYTRAAVFPVGKQYVQGRVAALPSVCVLWCAQTSASLLVCRGQKMEEGTPVVSTRAIKHMNTLVELSVPGVTRVRAGASQHPCIMKAFVLCVLSRSDVLHCSSRSRRLPSCLW